MKWFFVVFCLLCACESSQAPAPPLPPPAKQCQTVRIDRGPVKLLVWLDPEGYLENSYVLQALNQYWSGVGVQVSAAASPEKADMGFLYIQGSCKSKISTGRLQTGYWAKLNAVVLDSNCIHKPDFKKKFPAAVSHALGNLMGIEASPAYCGAGIMRREVLMMTAEPPAGLAEGDRQGFFHRNEFLTNRWEDVEECLPDPVAGKFQPAEFRTVRFSADAKFKNTGVENILNNYFALFGRSLQLTANEVEAEFKMMPWTLTEGGGCSPLAIAMTDRREIQVRVECLANSTANWAETILVHETAHLFGMNHIPNWCAPALMNPYVTALPHFTSMDVVEWQNRDKSESILDSNRVLRMKYQGVEADFLPLSRLRLEHLFRK